MNSLLSKTVTIKLFVLLNYLFVKVLAFKQDSIITTPNTNDDSNNNNIIRNNIETGDNSNKEISIIDNLWLNEIDVWSHAIDLKLNNTINHINFDINSILQDENTKLVEFINDYITTHQPNNTLIYDAISDIDCYWDKNLLQYVKRQTSKGQKLTILKQYITKPVITNMISENYQILNGSLRHLNEKLNLFNETVQTQIEQIVQFNIENYEEWGETIITEWSQRMSQMDILQLDWSLNQWNLFLTMKRKIINFHKDLLLWSPKLNRLSKILTQRQMQINEFYEEQETILQDLQKQAIEQFNIRDITTN